MKPKKSPISPKPRGGGPINERAARLETRLDNVEEQLHDLIPPVRATEARVRETLDKLSVMDGETHDNRDRVREHLHRLNNGQQVIGGRLLALENFQKNHEDTIKSFVRFLNGLRWLGRVLRRFGKFLTWAFGLGAASAAIIAAVKGGWPWVK